MTIDNVAPGLRDLHGALRGTYDWSSWANRYNRKITTTVDLNVGSLTARVVKFDQTFDSYGYADDAYLIFEVTDGAGLKRYYRKDGRASSYDETGQWDEDPSEWTDYSGNVHTEEGWICPFYEVEPFEVISINYRPIERTS